MLNSLISRAAILMFGTLYPAYSSYKALKARNSRSLVKWMMYWIIFAFFTTAEAVADIILSWLPMYYEAKILFLIWLLSPATNGTSYLYRKLIHPNLQKHEEVIDEYISEASKKGAETLLSVGARSINLCASTVLTTAIQGQELLVDKLKKSYSMSDLSVTPATTADPFKQQNDSSDDDDLEAGFFSEKNENLVRRPLRSSSKSSSLQKVPEDEVISEPLVKKVEPKVRHPELRHPDVRHRPYRRSASAPLRTKEV